MFYHIKELQFNAKVSKPDPGFARLLLEQFGGGNGELKAAMQYFVQAFAAKQPFPDKYDLLMDIATEEFSHLEIVGATIQMLMDGVNGELKNAVENMDLMKLLGGKAAKEGYIHDAIMHPDFLVRTGGGPTLTNCQGVPWSGAYVNANGDLTVDLRSDIAAESRAKIIYEYLMQYTDDPDVKATLGFLMTREVAHFQMFEAALDTIQPNFPPGVLQGDPRSTNKYFNLSNGGNVRGPWNDGQTPKSGETWEYVEDPLRYIMETEGMTKGKGAKSEGTTRTLADVQKKNKKLSKEKSKQIKDKVPKGKNQWSTYSTKK